MTAAAQLTFAFPPAPPPRPSGVRAVEAAPDRAARLALGLVRLVVALPTMAREDAVKARQEGREALQELEAILGVQDVGHVQRSTETDNTTLINEDAAALMCWSVLGEPVEAWILTWRAALDGRPVIGPRPQRMHEREEEDRACEWNDPVRHVPAYTIGG